MDKLESLTEQLKEQEDCIFGYHGNAIMIYESVENDFVYNIYDDYGNVLDGGVFDGTAKECIEFVLSDLKEK